MIIIIIVSLQGKEYHFVELVKALMHSSIENDSITAYSKACHPDDGIILTFEATTVCPRDGIEAFSHSNLQDICVSPLPHSASQTPVIFLYLPSFLSFFFPSYLWI